MQELPTLSLLRSVPLSTPPASVLGCSLFVVCSRIRPGGGQISRSARRSTRCRFKLHVCFQSPQIVVEISFNHRSHKNIRQTIEGTSTGFAKYL
jgi:hypothetical protein